MAKRTLSTTEAFDLRQTLQVAVLEALVASRRWAPGDLAFQGGTSLHLVHGSPRFSEDLDFLVKSSLDLSAIGAAVQARIGRSAWIPADAQLSVTKAKEGHNPHAFDVVIGGPSIIGAVRVRLELWQTPASALRALDVKVAQVRLVSGPAAEAQAFIPSLSTKEIHADKVFALAARKYLKPRDVFDLHWLREREPDLVCSSHDLALRLATYPNETAGAWILKAKARLTQLPGRHAAIARDLARWLPSSWPLRTADVQTMIAAATRSLADGIVQMEAVLSGKRRSAAADVP
jgi:predicted nucleotidyltransferase component of viral defense system